MAKSAIAANYENESIGAKLKSFPTRTRGFLSDVRNEMRHVSHPSVKEVRATTVVVIITVALFGAYFGVVDYLLGHGLGWVEHYFAK
ncbi:MAG: preprotein translocase subunit SecE [Acidobacteria bacterium]|nr:MAG: preprotein translocase subunit SecE [Acidobacteriota bacterium]